MDEAAAALRYKIARRLDGVDHRPTGSAWSRTLIGTRGELWREVAAWEEQRNEKGFVIQWQFDHGRRPDQARDASTATTSYTWPTE